MLTIFVKFNLKFEIIETYSKYSYEQDINWILNEPECYQEGWQINIFLEI